MRYRSGGPFADAVAAVRAGRRPPRPNQAPTIGRAAPAAIPGTQSRPNIEVRGPATTNTRARPATGSHRPPPPRSTFTSGQRALLWAAGVLGALAIVIAVLILVNNRDNNLNQQQSPPTVTDTVTPSPGAPESAPPAAPSNWTEQQQTGNPGEQTEQLVFRLRQSAALPAYHEISR